MVIHIKGLKGIEWILKANECQRSHKLGFKCARIKIVRILLLRKWVHIDGVKMKSSKWGVGWKE